MSQAVQVRGIYPCSSTDWCGELCTFQIYPISFILDFSGENTGSATVSVMFLVNGAKQYQTVTVPPAGLELSPPPQTTYMELTIQNGTGVPSSLSILVIQTYD